MSAEDHILWFQLLGWTGVHLKDGEGVLPGRGGGICFSSALLKLKTDMRLVTYSTYWQSSGRGLLKAILRLADHSRAGEQHCLIYCLC